MFTFVTIDKCLSFYISSTSIILLCNSLSLCSICKSSPCLYHILFTFLFFAMRFFSIISSVFRLLSKISLWYALLYIFFDPLPLVVFLYLNLLHIYSMVSSVVSYCMGEIVFKSSWMSTCSSYKFCYLWSAHSNVIFCLDLVFSIFLRFGLWSEFIFSLHSWGDLHG